MARYNVSLPENVIKVADRKAGDMGISRSAFIATAIMFKAQYDDTLSQMPKVIQMMDELKSAQIPETAAAKDIGK